MSKRIVSRYKYLKFMFAGLCAFVLYSVNISSDKDNVKRYSTKLYGDTSYLSYLGIRKVSAQGDADDGDSSGGSSGGGNGDGPGSGTCWNSGGDGTGGGDACGDAGGGGDGCGF